MEPVRRDRNRARTRQAALNHCLAVQYARIDIRIHSFAVRVEEDWNSLPDQVKMAKSKDVFKEGSNKTSN